MMLLLVRIRSVMYGDVQTAQLGPYRHRHVRVKAVQARSHSVPCLLSDLLIEGSGLPVCFRTNICPHHTHTTHLPLRPLPMLPTSVTSFPTSSSSNGLNRLHQPLSVIGRPVFRGHRCPQNADNASTIIMIYLGSFSNKRSIVQAMSRPLNLV